MRMSLRPMAGLAVVLTACAGPSGDAAEPAHASYAAMAAAVTADLWSGRSPSGMAVTVATEPDPPAPGHVRFKLAVTAGGQPHSVDLVSPTMPMHGVVRFPVAIADGAVFADVEIPMDGEWTLYVNFDDGADAAEFRFTVAAADSAATHHHH